MMINIIEDTNAQTKPIKSYKKYKRFFLKTGAMAMPLQTI